MLLSKLALQHDWKKAAGRHSLPRHCSQVPRYAGRWPFIGAAARDWQGGSIVSAARLERRREPAPSRGSARTEVGMEPLDDALLSAIRRNPLTAVGIAAGIGFAVAMAFAETSR